MLYRISNKFCIRYALREEYAVSKRGCVARRHCYEAATKDYYAGIYNNIFANQYQTLYQRYWLNTQRKAEWCEAWM